MLTLVALNVDYAATGPGHLDRAPCRVTLATAASVLADTVLRVEGLRDAMTGYTALAREEVEAATATLDDACAAAHAALAARQPVLLVGHGLARAARCLKLQKGQHYAAAVDVVEMLRTWNRRFGHWNYYALPKVAFVLGAAEPPRDSSERALALLAVYERLASRPGAVDECKAELQRHQYARTFPPGVGAKPPAPPGVCVWAYNAAECTCGQPLLGGKPTAGASAAEGTARS